MKLLDIHTHLNQYHKDEIGEILTRAGEVGVAGAILAGTTVTSSRDCINLANADNRLFAGIGIHPMDIPSNADHTIVEEIRKLSSEPRVLVISEVGLDRIEGAPDFRLQEEIFRAQIQLASDVAMPIIYHSRLAYPEILDILKDEQAFKVGGAAHYFQGDLDTAKQCIDLGFMISFARPVLRIPELQEVARKIPADSILLETDSFPQPFKRKRSTWTEPRHLVEIAECIAGIRGIKVDLLVEQTSNNLLSLLGKRASDVKSLINQ